MHQHLMQEPPPIRTFVPTLPQGLEPVFAKALAKKPAHRYPSIAEFARAFQAAANEQSRTFVPPFAAPTARQAADNAPTVIQSSVPPIAPPPITHTPAPARLGQPEHRIAPLPSFNRNHHGAMAGICAERDT